MSIRARFLVSFSRLNEDVILNEGLLRTRQRTRSSSEAQSVNLTNTTTITIINSSGFDYFGLIAQANNAFVTRLDRTCVFAMEIISSLTDLCAKINWHLDHLLSNSSTSRCRLGQQDTSFLIHFLLLLVLRSVFNDVFLSFLFSLSRSLSSSLILLSLSPSHSSLVSLLAFFCSTDTRRSSNTHNSYIKSLLNRWHFKTGRRQKIFLRLTRRRRVMRREKGRQERSRSETTNGIYHQNNNDREKR